jgi:RNA polymerase sigma factor (sigma-70 family)
VIREEFNVLALSYLEDIAAFARRLTGNAADADDLVQATFERAFEAWRKLRDPAACRAWLFRIARNLFLDSRRASAVRSQLCVVMDTETSTRAFIVPAEAVERLASTVPE